MKLSLLLLLLTVSSCAGRNNNAAGPENTSPPTQQQALETIQPGDNDLSCQDLMSQMNRMDQLAASGSEETSKSVTQAVAGTAASQGLGFVPIVGPVLSALAGVVSTAVGQPGSQQSEQKNTIVLAQQRKEHLLALYDQKKCSASSPLQP